MSSRPNMYNVDPIRLITGDISPSHQRLDPGAMGTSRRLSPGSHGDLPTTPYPRSYARGSRLDRAIASAR